MGVFDLRVRQVQFRGVFAVLSLVALALPAAAGNGIKLTSESTMHPMMQGGLAFDSNPHRSTGDTADSDMFMLLLGGFELAIPSDRLDVRMNNTISYHHYLGLMASAGTRQNTTLLSTVKGGTALQLLGNRKGKARWGVAAKINRLDEPEPLNLGVRQGRWSNSADAFVEWRPGGRALGLKPSGSLGLDIYDGVGSKLNKTTPGMRLDLDWRFLPRTQIVMNNAWTVAYYTNDTEQNGHADPVSSEIGFMGQVSPRLSAILAVGYSGSQFMLSDEANAKNALHTFSGQAEVRYDERRKVTWRLGVRRRLMPVSSFGIMLDNSAYARYSEKYRGGFRVVTQLKGSLRTFGAQVTGQDIISITGGAQRADYTVGFDANLLWQPGKSWMAGLTNRAEFFGTNSVFQSAGEGSTGAVNPGFFRNLTMLVFEAKY